MSNLENGMIVIVIRVQYSSVGTKFSSNVSLVNKIPPAPKKSILTQSIAKKDVNAYSADRKTATSMYCFFFHRYMVSAEKKMKGKYINIIIYMGIVLKICRNIVGQ